MRIVVNGTAREIDAEGDTPLLWVLRDELGLTGTKFGCGIGACGACTVHVNGEPVTSCTVPIEAVDGPITTIEGLGGPTLHPLQQAWMEASVPQCGYCQAGMIMRAAALLKEKPKPTDADIDEAMTNICRCGTYGRIRRAIKAVANA